MALAAYTIRYSLSHRKEIIETLNSVKQTTYSVSPSKSFSFNINEKDILEELNLPDLPFRIKVKKDKYNMKTWLPIGIKLFNDLINNKTSDQRDQTDKIVQELMKESPKIPKDYHDFE